MICSEKCGDFVITVSETCDDGNIISNDGCSMNCLTEQGFTCSGSLCTPICGDGLRVTGEVCDDGS